jgi:hypothetical protein
VPETHHRLSHPFDIVRSIEHEFSAAHNGRNMALRTGTRNALSHHRPLEWATSAPSPWEAPIRTLSVSLVAVAAIAASLLLSRSREEGDITDVVPAGENIPVRLKLDAIREAGL